MLLSRHTSFWQHLADALATTDKLMLLLVVDSKGSSPAKAGAKMFLTGQGKSLGSMGGGAFEQKILRMARRLLDDKQFNPQIIRHQHQLDAAEEASGMICGGEQTLLLYACRMRDKALFQQIAARPAGVLMFSPAGLQWHHEMELAAPYQFSYRNETDWLYQENLALQRQAYIVGGGHVSLALSKILATLDFDITVIDERDTPATLAHNHYAQIKLTMPYREIRDIIPEGDQVFVFIMTHSHKTDEKIAGQLAGKRVRYLGVLGSRKKMEHLKANLAHRLPVESLQRIRGPIGLPINSHTPAEIAVSIAAEVIQILNNLTES
jgi:xanthine dehydrogenase accessory factor